VLRATPLMLNEQSNIPTSTEKPTNSNADPPDRNAPTAPQKSEPPRVHKKYEADHFLKMFPDRR